MRPGRDIWRLAVAKPRQAAVWGVVVAGFVTRGALTGDGRVWAYLTVCLVCTAVVATTDRSVGYGDGALWLLTLAGALHLAGGLLPEPGGGGVLYDAWLVSDVLRFDQAVHVIGSAAGTVAAWQLLGTWLDLDRAPARTQACLAGLAGLGKGAINEALEFLAAIRFPGTYVGGFENTGWDLVFDVAGVAAAALFLVLARTRRTGSLRMQAAAA